MKEVKLFEVRDRMTLMPVLAVQVSGEGDPLLRYAGYGDAQVLLHPLSSGTAPGMTYDPHTWQTSARTIPEAHRFIRDNWDSLPDGSVVDVEYVLGETAVPKTSEFAR